MMSQVQILPPRPERNRVAACCNPFSIPCIGTTRGRPPGRTISGAVTKELFMKMLTLFLALLVSGCVTVRNIQDLLTDDEFSKREYYKCSQGISVDMGSVGNAGGGAAMAPALSLTRFLTAPMIFSNMHYKRTVGAPIADITVADAVKMATISSYFSFMSYCRTLGCDQPGKTCLEVDAKLLGYDKDNDAAVEVTITKTTDGEFMREYTTYRKVKLKGPAVELTDISEVEALRIREYFSKDYYPTFKGADARP
jgi:hypothetical protein